MLNLKTLNFAKIKYLSIFVTKEIMLLFYRDQEYETRVLRRIA